jgi:two-component system sensor histidine kinase TctE
MIPLLDRAGPWSVRRRLLALLLAPVAVLLVTGLLLNYLAGIGPVRAAFDRSLAAAALIIAAHVSVAADGSVNQELPVDADRALLAAGLRPTRIAVLDGNGQRLAGDAAMTRPAAAPGSAATNPRFGDASVGGERLRIAWYRFEAGGRPLIVAVGEPARLRERASLYVVTATLTVDALLLLTILGLVLLGVRRGLQPLLALRDRLAARSARELEPLDPHSVPAEVRALVGALNALFLRVRAAADAQQTFLADAAHQIRTPLAGMQAQLELLARAPAAAPVRDRIEALQASVRRLARTSHQLLTLARAESSATHARDFRPVELARLVEESAGAQLDRALAEGIDLGGEAQPATVTGVEWLLRELLNNLVDNALKYTPRGGVVTLRCGAVPGGAYLEVEDDGPGIPTAERPRVVQRFHRIAGTAGGGSGLGLAIVSDIAALHGARFALGPGAGGAGTRARIDFVVRAAAPTASGESPSGFH